MERITMMIILAIIIVIGLIIAIISARARRKEGRKPNFKAFFIIGITWIPIGIATQNYVFMVAGLAFMILGFTKKKEWKDQPKWEDLSPAEKKMKLALIIFLSLILILGVVFYFIVGN
ncbi:MAG: hypothetical protein HOD64_10400 [Candidatus Cloacimonetes bacterium]|jgi:hypothetical protein|nr:hypothetical protein [Candidatus Cloacimonadota bacterium]